MNGGNPVDGRMKRHVIIPIKLIKCHMILSKNPAHSHRQRNTKHNVYSVKLNIDQVQKWNRINEINSSWKHVGRIV